MRTRTLTETLLADADWLRRLAACLVDNRADADDLVQGAWLSALRSPPTAGRPHRPWLAQVLRNVFRMDARGGARRRAREKEAAGALLVEQPSPLAVLERLQIQKTVAALLVELEEPYRSTLTYRFFDGVEPAEIGRMQDVPSGTVRWRINEGLRRLRQRLDEAHDGRRDAWRSVLLPLLAPPGRRGLTTIAAVAGTKTAFVAVGALALTVTTVVAGSGGGPSPFARNAAPAREPPPAPSGAPALAQVARAMARMNAVLPRLVTSPEHPATPLSRAQAIDLCLELRATALACREEAAGMLAARQPIYVAIGLVDRDPLPLTRRRAMRLGATTAPSKPAVAPAPALSPRARRGDDGFAAGILEELDASGLSEAACAAAVDRSPWISRATLADRDAVLGCDQRGEACQSVLGCRQAALGRMRERMNAAP
jgi:RNA polymerase sigma-70 factor (ECF subfamily)